MGMQSLGGVFLNAGAELSVGAQLWGWDMWRELGKGVVRKPDKSVVGCAEPCHPRAAPEWPCVGEHGQGNGRAWGG